MRLLESVWRAAWPWRARLAGPTGPASVFPDFELEAPGGARHRLSDHGGKRTVLWFTNLCDGCQERAALLGELALRSGSLLRVLAINVLEEEETARRLAPSLPFPILLDPEDIVQKRFGIAHPPGTCPLKNLYVLAPGGAVLFTHHLSAMRPAEVLRLAER